MLDFSSTLSRPLTTIEEAADAVVKWLSSEKGMRKIFVIPDRSIVKIVEINAEYANSASRRPMPIVAEAYNEVPFPMSFLMLSTTDYERVIKKRFVPLDDWKHELWRLKWEAISNG